MAAESERVLDETRGGDATQSRAPKFERVALPAQRVSRDFVTLANDVLSLYDFIAVGLTGYASRLIWDGFKYSQLPDARAALTSSSVALVAAVVAASMLRDRQLTTLLRFQRRRELLGRLASRFVVVAGVLLGIGFATRALDSVPRGWVALWAGLAFGAAVAGRLFTTLYLARLEQRGFVRDVIAIVGAGSGADRLIGHLKRTRGAGIEILGVFDDRGSRHGSANIAPVGTVADLLDQGKHRRIDWIVVNLPVSAEQRIVDICFETKALAASVALCPIWIGPRAIAQTDLLCDEFAVSVLADRPIRGRDIVIKRLTDALIGGALVVALAPFMALIAAAVALESPGPVFFRQTRHGWNNREFTILKFRTMRWHGEQSGPLVQTTRLDRRVTRLGRFLRKTSLDELPQLFNVLQGEMSLVGPRPHAINMTTENLANYQIVREYAHRHRMKPGITGWAQVNGFRGATNRPADMRRRVEFDLHYVENWSLWLDLKILLRTAFVVFGGRNAY